MLFNSRRFKMSIKHNVALHLVICIILFDIHLVICDEKSLAMDMLKKYNYMGDGHPDLRMMKDDMFTEALRDFQAFACINETGIIDKMTMDKLTSMRCGVPDIIDKGSIMRRRRKRYSLAGSKWTGVIGYRFKRYSRTSSLRPTAIRGEIRRALNEWSKHADVQFKEQGTLKKSDIVISFERKDHNDGSPFDGPGMVLAHAFFPSRDPIGGDLHFDDDEKWTVGSNKGVDLYYVALHEIGHSLGLQHSPIKNAVMHPYYKGFDPKLALHHDDIKGIQALYGKRMQIEPTTPRLPETPDNEQPEVWMNEFCQNGTVDAIGLLNDNLFVFQGALYVALNQLGILPGFPRRIHDDWIGLPSDIDAALSLEDYNIILIFKGSEYWRYTLDSNNKPRLANGYPRNIAEDFLEGLPGSVDAVFRWSDNGRIYVIKDGMYYRIRDIQVYDDMLQAKGERWFYGYPKSFPKNWDIEPIVSDALFYHDRTFFFTDRQYLRYNDNAYKMDSNYPKNTAASWFGCRSPDSLDKPTMEMDAMERESQFEQIPTSRASSQQAAIILTVVSVFPMLVFRRVRF